MCDLCGAKLYAKGDAGPADFIRHQLLRPTVGGVPPQAQ